MKREFSKSEDLPTSLSKAEENMIDCVLFGLPKCGKTTLLSKLDNCLIIDTENGTNKLSCLRKQVPNDLGPVGKYNWLNDYADFLIESGKPYDYIAVDSFTEVNDWTEWSGTMRYMKSVQGKSFNREFDKNGNPIKGGKMLPSDDDNYQSVHTLPDGNGYRYSREDLMRIFEKLRNASKKCTFFICHVEDKYLGLKENTEIIAPKQLSLTGKLRNIIPRKVDAIGYVYNDEGIIKVNFTGSEERTGGNRCQHLRGYNDVADWKKIFINN